MTGEGISLIGYQALNILLCTGRLDLIQLTDNVILFLN